MRKDGRFHQGKICNELREDYYAALRKNQRARGSRQESSSQASTTAHATAKVGSKRKHAEMAGSTETEEEEPDTYLEGKVSAKSRDSRKSAKSAELSEEEVYDKNEYTK